MNHEVHALGGESGSRAPVLAEMARSRVGRRRLVVLTALALAGVYCGIAAAVQFSVLWLLPQTGVAVGDANTVNGGEHIPQHALATMLFHTYLETMHAPPRPDEWTTLSFGLGGASPDPAAGCGQAGAEAPAFGAWYCYPGFGADLGYQMFRKPGAGVSPIPASADGQKIKIEFRVLSLGLDGIGAGDFCVGVAAQTGAAHQPSGTVPFFVDGAAGPSAIDVASYNDGLFVCKFAGSTSLDFFAVRNGVEQRRLSVGTVEPGFANADPRADTSLGWDSVTFQYEPRCTLGMNCKPGFGPDDVGHVSVFVNHQHRATITNTAPFPVVHPFWAVRNAPTAAAADRILIDFFQIVQPRNGTS